LKTITNSRPGFAVTIVARSAFLALTKNKNAHRLSTFAYPGALFDKEIGNLNFHFDFSPILIL
jgi:hypothetical protein